MGDRKENLIKKPESGRKPTITDLANPPVSGSTLEHSVLQMQHTIGNQAVQHILCSGLIQAKLNISQPGDIYEEEAERTAEMVMRLPEPQLWVQSETAEAEDQIYARPISDQITPIARRQANKRNEAKKAKEYQNVQTKEVAGKSPIISPAMENQIDSLHSGGQPLPPSVRAFYEPRFGVDLSRINLHTDENASKTAHDLNVKAFTINNDIVFGQGQYAPQSSEGRKLLAHELTHVIQQSTYDEKLNRKRILCLSNRGFMPRTVFAEESEAIDISLQPPSKNSAPTPEKIRSLRQWLEAHIADHALAKETYTFYEVIDQYLGPWGESGYPLGYGKHYNILFIQNKTLMANPNTKDWVWKTTIKLQEALVEFVVQRYSEGNLNELKESELREAAFESHPKAYTQGGLALVAVTAPELLPVIVSIPKAEFMPGSPNLKSSFKQVATTAEMVIPEILGYIVAAAVPAHSGLLRSAMARDRSEFLSFLNLNQNLIRLRKMIENNEVNNIRTLNEITDRLYRIEYPDKGFTQVARDIINLANKQKAKLAQQYADAIKKDPDLKQLYDKIESGWELWLQYR